MPIFEYKCKTCGHTMDFIEKSGRRNKHVCKRCQSSDLQKLLSRFSVGQSSKSSPQGGDSCPTGTCGLT